MILMNIAICDFITITVLYPLQHIIYNVSHSVGFIIAYTSLSLIISSASCLSILALSIQRLVLLVKTPVSSNGTKRWKIFLFVISVWFAIPAWIFLTILFLIVIGGAHFIAITVVFPITVFSCLLPVVITVLNSVTSYRLRKTAREMPGEHVPEDQVQTRYRSARVIHFLCLVYWVGHFPFFLLQMYGNYVYALEFGVKYIIWTVNSLFALNAVFNPLALITMSRNFRHLYKKYIFDCIKTCLK